MKALLVSTLSDDLSGTGIAEVAVPERAEGQLLVRVRAAALNYPDLLMTRGAYQLKPPLPFIPGMEMAGEVVAADADSGFAVGDRVVAGTRTGSFAECVAVDAASAQPVPPTLSDADAAAFGATAMTAWVTLVRLARLGPGEWVLVHGASGGVGLATIGLAHALGARVIATSRSAEKRAMLARDHRVAAVLPADGFRDAVKALTDGRGADVIVDPVGGDVFDESTRCIAFGGRIMVVGFTAGRPATLATNIALIKGFSVIGVRAGEYGRRHPDHGKEDRTAIWRMAAEGQLSAHVDRRYPLDDWRAAFDAMAAGDLIGKLVIEP